MDASGPSAFGAGGSGPGFRTFAEAETGDHRYIFVMVKLPDPVQPPLPVNDHVPEMVLPFAVPESVSVLPEGEPESTLKPKLPFTWPFKFPLNVNEPLSVSPETKQAESVVKLKLEIDNEWSPFTVSDVPKVNAGDPPPLLISVAFQVPLMLDEFEFEFEPQPISVTPAISSAARAKCFIEKHSWAKVRSGAKAERTRAGGCTPPL